MNTLYMMMDEKRDYALFKVGFTTNMDKRLAQYACHNPLVECISTLATMGKTGRQLEHRVHTELSEMGYDRVVALLDGRTTEWFKVAYTDPLYTELKVKGLLAFKVCKGRKERGEVRA